MKICTLTGKDFEVYKPSGFFKRGGKHKTCWQCIHIRVQNFPTRFCLIYPDVPIWSGDSKSEFFELNCTRADNCKGYKLDKERKSKYSLKNLEKK